MFLFSSKSNNDSYLGIDIGSFSIKMVELAKRNKKIKLLNYSFTENKSANISNNDDSNFLHGIIETIYKQNEFKSNRAIVSLPSSDVFSSVISLSNVDKNNLNNIIRSEAAKIMPIDINDVALDWKIIEAKDDNKQNEKNSKTNNKEKNNIEVFITGASKTTIKKYIDIFHNLDITLSSLETEIFSLIRAFSIDKTINQMIVEIGTSSTDISIIKNNVPILNKSIKFGGENIVKVISDSLGINSVQARIFKKDLDILNSSGDQLPKLIVETINPVIVEIKYILNLFKNKYNQDIDNIILSGGTASLTNLAQYISEQLGIIVTIGDPWYDIEYKSELKNVLTEIGPMMSVAVGLAKRELI